MNNNHRPCSFENKEFGVWEKVKHPFPYGWFFNYWQLKYEGSTYFDRGNKLDGLFDWICGKLK